MPANDKITIYTPEPALKNPLKLFKELMWDLGKARSLAWRLFMRNIRGQYRQSILGIFWVFIPPLITTLTWIFLQSSRIFQIGDTGSLPYPVFVLTGTLLWTGFNEALTKPIQAMNTGKSMLTKLNFPRESLIMAGLIEVLFNFLVKLVILIPLFIIFGIIPNGSILLAPLGLLSIMTLGFGIGIWLTPLGMLYNDISRGIQFVITFWFFITPVVYPMPKEGMGALVASWNPVTPLLVNTRHWLTGGEGEQMLAFGLVFLLSLFLLFSGLFFLRIALTHLIARIGS